MPSNLPQDCLVLIPCFNSLEITKVVQELLKAGFHVLVIDDGSNERTHKRICSLNCEYISHPKNLGQGAALESGMAYARKSTYSFLAHFDADGQHRVEDLE